jgi:hypothetical protein
LARMASNDRGMALVIVLVLISILGLLFGLGGRGSGLSLGSAGQSNARNIAYFTAQGALQRGLTELRRDPAWTGTKNAPFPGIGGKTYDIQVITNTKTTPQPTPAGVDIAPGSTLVLATGRAGSSERTVAGIVEAAGTAGSGYAALVQGEFLVRGGTVGAFSAPNGFALADMVPESGVAQIGSLNQKIVIQDREQEPDSLGPLPPVQAKVDGTVASPDVDGDISTAEPGVYSVENATQLSGETKLDAPPTLNLPSPPPNYLGGPAIVKNGGSKTILPGHYDNVALHNDTILYLEPGDYYFKGDFRTHDTSQVHTKGAVRIFIDGLLVSGGTSSLNHEGDPRDCEIVLSGLAPGPEGKVGWVSSESHAWARIKPLNGTLGVSGTIFGDVQGAGVDIIGDPDGSGALHFFTELAEEGGGIGSEAGDGDLIYATTWTVK